MILQDSFLLLVSLVIYASFQTANAFASFPGWGPTYNRRDNTHDTKLSSTTVKGDCIKTSQLLSLDSIRSTLIRQEETIIFAIIERAQFRTNDIVYQKGGFGNLGTPLGSNKEAVEKMQGNLSFMDWLLIGTVSHGSMVITNRLKYPVPKFILIRSIYHPTVIGSIALWCSSIHVSRGTSILS